MIIKYNVWCSNNSCLETALECVYVSCPQKPLDYNVMNCIWWQIEQVSYNIISYQRIIYGNEFPHCTHLVSYLILGVPTPKHRGFLKEPSRSDPIHAWVAICGAESGQCSPCFGGAEVGLVRKWKDYFVLRVGYVLLYCNRLRLWDLWYGAIGESNINLLNYFVSTK